MVSYFRRHNKRRTQTVPRIQLMNGVLFWRSPTRQESQHYGSMKLLVKGYDTFQQQLQAAPGGSDVILGRCSISAVIVARVKEAYNNLVPRQAGEENPIEKRLLVVTGDDATLCINEVIPTNVGHGQPQQQQQAGGEQQGGHIEGHTNRQLLHTLLNQVNQLQTSVSNITETREADRVMLSAQFRTINLNIRRIASQPINLLNNAAQQNNNAGGGGGGGGVANSLLSADLSPTPRTLYVLWQEYQVGIGGRKAARLFTREERGRVKHKYHRRKVVWDLVSRLINSGLSAQVACDRIYNVYGDDKTVTHIINKLKADSQNGTLHVNLQV